MGDKISVIVPVYNVEAYLEKCVNSIKNQTYKNLEIILINDGSTDSSGSICDELSKTDDRIVVYHKENGGVSSARNLGLSKITGDFFTFVDSDDLLLEETIEYMHRLLFHSCSDKDNSVICDISICGVKNVYYDENHLSDNIKNNEVYLWNSKEALREFLIAKKTSFFPVAKLFSKRLVSITNFNENIKLAEDALFITEILLSENLSIVFGQEVGYLYCHRANSATSKIEYEPSVMDTIKVHDYIREEILKKYPELINELTTRKNWSYIHVFDKLLFYSESKDVSENKKIIKEYLLKSIHDIFKDRHFTLARRCSLLTLFLSESIYKNILNKNKK